MAINRELTGYLEASLPGARIESQPLPMIPALELFLLNHDYPQSELSREAIKKLMDDPLYWVFCWASGQVLASFLFEHPEWVRAKRVLDFGCGSGVAGIAAAMAGAREVIACDTDPLALKAAQYNMQHNKVDLELTSDFFSIAGEIDLIIVADVLYDSANIAWLQRFVQRAKRVLIADSRVRDFDYPPYRLIDRREACTVPDLDESAEFRDVRIFMAD